MAESIEPTAESLKQKKKRAKKAAEDAAIAAIEPNPIPTQPAGDRRRGISMQNIPSRPRADKAMILAACTEVAEKLDGADAETIAQYYCRGMDGFQLAKELDKSAYWDTTRDDMETLDEVDYLVDKAERAAIKEWAATYNPQPQFPIGARIEQGVITGIADDYSPATYLVKENGCTNDSRSLLIKFENAKLAPLNPA